MTMTTKDGPLCERTLKRVLTEKLPGLSFSTDSARNMGVRRKQSMSIQFITSATRESYLLVYRALSLPRQPSPLPPPALAQ